LATSAAAGGFVGWILNYGQIILFFAQLFFWIVVGVAALWAAVVFNRFVNFAVGGASSGDKPAEKAVSVDQFVE